MAQQRSDRELPLSLPNHPVISKRFKGSTPKQEKLADLVVKQGKPMKEAVLDAGYSPSLAKLGISQLRRQSVGIDMAFVEAAKGIKWDAEEAKACIRARLLSDLTRGKSSGLERVAELLGRDKSIDLFVRSGDIQIGIFASSDDSRTIDAPPTLEASALPDPEE